MAYEVVQFAHEMQADAAIRTLQQNIKTLNQKGQWGEKALQELKTLREKVHKTHTTAAAVGPLGKCYLCGNGLNELIAQGETLFRE